MADHIPPGLDDNFYDCGVLKLCVMSALIEKDAGKLLGDYRPYIQFDYQDRNFQTRVGSGKNAKWNHIFEFQVSSLSDEVIFKLIDYDFFVPEAIGICNIKLSALCINEGVDEFTCPVYYGQTQVATLTLIS